jgi:sulfonate dioxygenase
VSSISSVNWHVDHTAEVQPPGITFFFGLEVPPVRAFSLKGPAHR